jgi:hypothetical protein
MKVQEIVTEAKIGDLTIGNIHIVVDEHALNQAVDRMVLPTDVDRVLRKLPQIQDQLEQIESGQKFWVYDPTLDVGLGLRSINPERLRYQFKTVVGDRPYDGIIPVLEVK